MRDFIQYNNSRGKLSTPLTPNLLISLNQFPEVAFTFVDLKLWSVTWGSEEFLFF